MRSHESTPNGTVNQDDSSAARRCRKYNCITKVKQMKVNRVMFNAMFNLLVLLRQVVVGVRRRQVVVVSSEQVRLFLFSQPPRHCCGRLFYLSSFFLRRPAYFSSKTPCAGPSSPNHLISMEARRAEVINSSSGCSEEDGFMVCC